MVFTLCFKIFSKLWNIGLDRSIAISRTHSVPRHWFFLFLLHRPFHDSMTEEESSADPHQRFSLVEVEILCQVSVKNMNDFSRLSENYNHKTKTTQYQKKNPKSKKKTKKLIQTKTTFQISMWLNRRETSFFTIFNVLMSPNDEKDDSSGTSTVAHQNIGFKRHLREKISELLPVTAILPTG